MSHLESVSPMVVAWAVSLGFGGLLLILAFSDESSAPGESLGQRPDGNELVAQKADGPSDELPAAGHDADSPKVSEPPEPVVTSVPSTPLQPTEKSGPVEPKPVEPKPVEPKPVEPKPVEPKPVEPKPVEPKPVEPKPVEPKPVAVPRPAREITRALKLPIVRYSHKEPVAVSLILGEVAQLAGVEVRLADGLADDPRLAKTVRLELDKTTVGGILEAVLEMIGLTHRVHDGYLQILPSVKGVEPRGS